MICQLRGLDLTLRQAIYRVTSHCKKNTVVSLSIIYVIYQTTTDHPDRWLTWYSPVSETVREQGTWPCRGADRLATKLGGRAEDRSSDPRPSGDGLGAD